MNVGAPRKAGGYRGSVYEPMLSDSLQELIWALEAERDTGSATGPDVKEPTATSRELDVCITELQSVYYRLKYGAGR